MRLGVLDVGSNTVHLLVVDAYHGAPPRSKYSYKTELRLAELLCDDGSIGKDGIRQLVGFVSEAAQVAEDKGAESMLAFATSAVRDATNGDEVLVEVERRSGVQLQVLSGEDEARLTFLAVRRWFGWSSGRLLVFDIGGGSLEVAVGRGEAPDGAFSLPLGAGRLTRDWLPGDPPDASDLKKLRKHVRAEIARVVPELGEPEGPVFAVGTSKTFRQLARIGGAAPSAEGPFVARVLTHAALEGQIPQLTSLTAEERADLPGVSPGRAGQLVAGALVADACFDLFEVDEVHICPWALREGIILRRLDMMDR
jgi:exopolyphosphatase / guanosine-5'-triphosphate,3'-diphosphate pyrophosphatase